MTRVFLKIVESIHVGKTGDSTGADPQRHTAGIMSPAAPDSPSINLPTSTHPRISAIKRSDLARALSTLNLGQTRAPARSYLPY